MEKIFIGDEKEESLNKGLFDFSFSYPWIVHYVCVKRSNHCGGFLGQERPCLEETRPS